MGFLLYVQMIEWIERPYVESENGRDVKFIEDICYFKVVPALRKNDHAI